MRWFKKEPKPKRYELHKVLITYEVLVNAHNEVHAVNLTRELRNDLWAATREYVMKFAMSESARAKKL